MPNIAYPQRFVELKDFLATPQGKEKVMRLALQHLNFTRSKFRVYDEEVRQWYTSGDGKTHGFRYPYCRHGVSLWTDYDPMCGQCENGENYFDYPREASASLAWAKRRYEMYFERIQLWYRLQLAGYQETANVREWAEEALSPYWLKDKEEFYV